MESKLPPSTSLPEDLQGWLGVIEVAKQLHIHPQSLRRLIKTGKFEGAIFFSGMYLIHTETLEAFKEKGYDFSPGRKPGRRLL